MSKQTAGADATAMSELSYEAAFAQLEAVIAQLESGDLALEQSLTQYEEGVKLAARCQQLLEAADLRVRQWQQDAEPADFDEWRNE